MDIQDVYSPLSLLTYILINCLYEQIDFYTQIIFLTKHLACILKIQNNTEFGL